MRFDAKGTVVSSLLSLFILYYVKKKRKIIIIIKPGNSNIIPLASSNVDQAKKH